MSRRKIITAQEMNDLFIDAMAGDWQAEAEFRNAARLLAKRSNQQLLEQERRGIEGEAYRRAQYALGDDRTRFKENVKNLDIEDLRAQVDEMIIFSNSKDYSLSYASKAAEQIDNLYEPLLKAGIDVDDYHVMWNMNELFKTDAWKEMKKFFGGDTGLIKEAQDAFTQGKTVDDLIDAYDDYMTDRDNSDLVTTWNVFTGKW